MKNDKPLSGYRVVDLTTFMAAPSCGRMLADWGADVIKVEALSGEPFRYFGTTVLAPANDEENPMWDIMNANKRGVAIDLKSPEGKQVLHRLLETADVFLTNNRPEALAKLKLDYESLQDKYPRLIYALVTGFGEKGPDVDAPGFDTVAYWGRSGFMVDLVRPGEYPVYSPGGFGDLTVGTTLFGGICAALLKRERTGNADKVSVALYGASIWFSSLLITCTQECYGYKFPKTRLEGNPMAVPYRCKDGEWILITVIEFERYWPAFCKALDREDLLSDERFKTRADMSNHRNELIPILETIFATKDSSEWIQRLKEADVVHDKLRHFKDVTKDEQAWANDFIYETTFANGKKAVLPAPPIQLSQVGALPRERGPLLGEHTKEVLEGVGYSSEQIEEMKSKKIIKVR